MFVDIVFILITEHFLLLFVYTFPEVVILLLVKKQPVQVSSF